MQASKSYFKGEIDTCLTKIEGLKDDLCSEAATGNMEYDSLGNNLYVLFGFLVNDGDSNDMQNNIHGKGSDSILYTTYATLKYDLENLHTTYTQLLRCYNLVHESLTTLKKSNEEGVATFNPGVENEYFVESTSVLNCFNSMEIKAFEEFVVYEHGLLLLETFSQSIAKLSKVTEGLKTATKEIINQNSEWAVKDTLFATIDKLEADINELAKNFSGFVKNIGQFIEEATAANAEWMEEYRAIVDKIGKNLGVEPDYGSNVRSSEAVPSGSNGTGSGTTTPASGSNGTGSTGTTNDPRNGQQQGPIAPNLPEVYRDEETRSSQGENDPRNGQQQGPVAPNLNEAYRNEESRSSLSDGMYTINGRQVSAEDFYKNVRNGVVKHDQLVSMGYSDSQIREILNKSVENHIPEVGAYDYSFWDTGAGSGHYATGKEACNNSPEFREWVKELGYYYYQSPPTYMFGPDYQVLPEYEAEMNDLYQRPYLSEKQWNGLALLYQRHYGKIDH